MNKTINSELILEVAKSLRNSKGYSKTIKNLKHNVQKVDIGILSDAVAQKIGREKGNYICLNFDDLLMYDAKAKQYLTKKICDALKEIFRRNKTRRNKVLVVGIGNEKFACDRLGKSVVDGILITKPFLEKNLFDSKQMNEVYAVSLGVYGTTGLDSSEVVASICAFLKPDVVIAIDSLVASDPKGLCRSVQISDTSLVPGAGVGNSRKEINTASLGVKTFAIGVPFVVSSANFCKEQGGEDMIVTPKDCEQKVEFIGKIIAKSLNLALNNLTEAELFSLTE